MERNKVRLLKHHGETWVHAEFFEEVMRKLAESDKREQYYLIGKIMKTLKEEE